MKKERIEEAVGYVMAFIVLEFIALAVVFLREVIQGR